MTSTIPMHKSIYTAEEQADIRKNLKESVGYSREAQSSQNTANKYKSEAHHLKNVPFEGTVYNGVGCTLDTKEINKKYKQSLTSVWWIVAQSILVFFRRASH